MFDVGFSELLLCFIVALVVLGPEKLPKVARTVGRWSGQARGYMRNLTHELDRESRLVELKQELESARRMMREEVQSAQDSVGNLVKPGLESIQDAKAETEKLIKDSDPRP